MDKSQCLGSVTPCQAAAVSSVRHIDIRRMGILLSNNTNETSLELDSHADTCCVGKNALIVYDFNRPVTVYGYDEALGPQTFATVTAVVNYINPENGSTIHLVIHQAIHIPTIDHHLSHAMSCE